MGAETTEREIKRLTKQIKIAEKEKIGLEKEQTEIRSLIEDEDVE